MCGEFNCVRCAQPHAYSDGFRPVLSDAQCSTLLAHARGFAVEIAALGSPTLTLTLDEQIKSVEREIGMRESVYPKWVRAGKMSDLKASREIAAMRAVLSTLHSLKGV